MAFHLRASKQTTLREGLDGASNTRGILHHNSSGEASSNDWHMSQGAMATVKQTGPSDDIQTRCCCVETSLCSVIEACMCSKETMQ